jgi:hypothetical protein
MKVGDIVIPNLGEEDNKLLLWSDGYNPNVVIAEVEANEILTIIKIQKFDEKYKNLQPEWENSSCLLLGPEGVLGWTGVGWVKNILPTIF